MCDASDVCCVFLKFPKDILSRAGHGRVRHLSTRVLWTQQRAERKELSVGAVPSSENVAGIGTKRLLVPSMKYLMHTLGVYDMAWIDWFMMGGVIVNLFKFPFMQLYYLIQLLSMQLSYVFGYAYPYSHGLVVMTASFFDVAATWIGRVCIVVIMFCAICRLIYGKEAIQSKAGRLFVLGVEWVQCLCSPASEWYGRRMIKHHQSLRQEAFNKVPKDRAGILRAQNGIIEWTSFMRFIQGLVHNFFDDDDGPKESAAEKLQRYQNCSMSECSDPE